MKRSIQIFKLIIKLTLPILFLIYEGVPQFKYQISQNGVTALAVLNLVGIPFGIYIVIAILVSFWKETKSINGVFNLIIGFCMFACFINSPTASMVLDVILIIFGIVQLFEDIIEHIVCNPSEPPEYAAIATYIYNSERDPWSDNYNYDKDQDAKGKKCVNRIRWSQSKNHIKHHRGLFQQEINSVEYDEFGVNKGMHVWWKQEGRPAPYNVVHNIPRKWLSSTIWGTFIPVHGSLILLCICSLYAIVNYFVRGRDAALIIDGFAIIIAVLLAFPCGLILFFSLLGALRRYFCRDLYYDSIITDANIIVNRRNEDNGISGMSTMTYTVNGVTYQKRYKAEFGRTNFLYCDKDKPGIVCEGCCKKEPLATSFVIRGLLASIYIYLTTVLYIGTETFNIAQVEPNILNGFRMMVFFFPIVMMIFTSGSDRRRSLRFYNRVSEDTSAQKDSLTEDKSQIREEGQEEVALEREQMISEDAYIFREADASKRDTEPAPTMNGEFSDLCDIHTLRGSDDSTEFCDIVHDTMEL